MPLNFLLHIIRIMYSKKEYSDITYLTQNFTNIGKLNLLSFKYFEILNSNSKGICELFAKFALLIIFSMHYLPNIYESLNFLVMTIFLGIFIPVIATIILFLYICVPHNLDLLNDLRVENSLDDADLSIILELFFAADIFLERSKKYITYAVFFTIPDFFLFDYNVFQYFFCIISLIFLIISVYVFYSFYIFLLSYLIWKKKIK